MQWVILVFLISSPLSNNSINKFFSKPSVSFFSSFSNKSGFLYGSTVGFNEFKGVSFSFTVLNRNFYKRGVKNLSGTYGYFNFNYKHELPFGYFSISLLYGGALNLSSKNYIFSRRVNF